MEMEKKVLSIQSHVVSGYVGNKCAVFPLQILGFEVDPINSVQLSNHTGYKVFKGQVLEENDLSCLMDGLAENDIDKYDFLLTGYVGNVSFLKQVVCVIQHLKEKNPSLIYVCDPVMGDENKLYVPKELVPVYRNEVVPVADIIMPNKYELQWLVGKEVNSVGDALDCIKVLHQKGCKVVVMTSAEFEEGVLTVIGSSQIGSAKKCATINVDKINCQFTGTGDLFGALFVAWMAKSNNDVVIALENTVATLNAVIRRTYAYAQSSGNTEGAKIRELRLIQSKADIENPKVIHRAKVINDY